MDGTLKFNTKLDTKGVKDGVTSTEDVINKFIEAIKKLGKDTDQAFNQSSKVIDLKNKISETEKQVASLSKELDVLGSKEFHSKEFDKLSLDVDRAESKLEELLETRGRLENSIVGDTKDLGFNVTPEMEQELIRNNSEWKKLSANIEAAESKLNSYQEKLSKIQTNDSSTNSNDTAAYQKKEMQLDKLSNRLEVYKKRLEETEAKENSNANLTRKASKAIEKKKSSVDKTNKSTGKYNRTLAMLGQSLMFSVIFRAFNSVFNGIKEGFQNLAQYSSQSNKDMSTLATSLLTLKNSLATAFSPIMTAITPALQTLINYLTSAISTIGQFFAVLLNGSKTFTKAKTAQVDYAKSLKNIGKEATKTLSPIDQLNNTTSGKGSGGEGASGPSPTDMFEEVEIDSKIIDFIDMLKVKLEPVIDALDRLKKAATPFAKNVGAGLKWFYTNVLVPLGNWTITNLIPTFLDLIGAAITVLNSLLETFKPYGIWLWENFLQPLAQWTGGIIITVLQQLTTGLYSLSDWIMSNQGTIANAVLLIGSFFAAFKIAEFIVWIAPLVSAFGSFITSGGLLSTVLSGLSAIISALSAPVVLIAAVLGILIYTFIDLYKNSEDFRESIAELGKTWYEALKPLAEFIGTVLSDAWNVILKPIIEFFIDTLLPNLIDTFKSLWENVLVPLGTFIGTVLQPVFQILSDQLTSLWKNVVLPLAKAVGEVFKAAWDGLYAILNKTIIPILKTVIDSLTYFWKKVIIPIINVLWDNLKPAFDTVFSGIGDLITGFKDMLTGLIKVITGVFTGDWKTAWDGVKQIFKGVFESLVALVRTPINAIIDIINGMISGIATGINTVIKAINSLSFSLPKELGGFSIGFNLKEVTAPKIPKIPAFANGTVVPANYGEFLGILGDNKREPEVVSPISTMKQAVSEAIQSLNLGGKEIHVHVHLDGKEIHEAVVNEENEAFGATGQSSFAYMGGGV